VTESRPRPEVPDPERIRSIASSFGWLDARLLHEGWLGRLGPEALGVLVFLVLAADRRGASYYGREKMARILGVERRDLDRGLARLVELGLVAHRRWSQHQQDGVWQVLPVPDRGPGDRHGPSPEDHDRRLPETLAAILSKLTR